MNLSIKAAFVIAVALVPALAFAQSNEPLTREQVRAQLEELEKAGYNPLADCTGECPEGLLRAEARVAQQRADANAGYGPSLDGTVQSGK
ncbi:DUF4148 domain-containing protein [Paraburkholderia nodosa]|uniref:DUF4148 domain-containing protein n=1 Tax=Paraburkholderia nodosa TaxID=392320 RepID=UPI000484456F|nr:DUF4148 domain-containing protein [Paraburkholderia nodosa]